MVESISRDTTLAQVQRSLKSLQLQWKQARSNLLPLGEIDVQRLVSLLPDKTTTDRLVQVYWETFETIYRVLHRPDFWTDYYALWENPLAASADFLVTVLLVVATVSCVSPVSPQEPMSYIGDSSTLRERAIALVEISESWLERQSQKNLSLARWQCRCLALLARISNTIKKKQTWNVAGNLLRQAMSAGFHRDPSLLGTPMRKIDQEMRRRLWATIMELELQVSIERGMPSMLTNVTWDTTNVLDVLDEELDETGEERLSQPPWSPQSTASFLHSSRASLSLRLSLAAAINDTNSPLTHDEVLKHDEQLISHLQKLNSTSKEHGTNTRYTLSETVLDLQLRQFLLLLHTPFAVEQRQSSRASTSRLACLNAASTVIESSSKLSKTDYNFISLTRTDFFRSAFVICQVIEAMRGLQRKKSTGNMRTMGLTDRSQMRCYFSAWAILCTGMLK
jgi:hypothetical protein